jgi:hypothetical protein
VIRHPWLTESKRASDIAIRMSTSIAFATIPANAATQLPFAAAPTALAQ